MPDWVPGTLPAWCSLTACLTWGEVVACLEGLSLAGCWWWPCFLPGRKCCHWEGGKLPGLLPACLLQWPERLLSCFLPQGEGENLPDCLPWDTAKLPPSPEGRWAIAWEAKPFLPSPEGKRAPACLRCWNCYLPWGKVCLPACLGRS